MQYFCTSVWLTHLYRESAWADFDRKIYIANWVFTVTNLVFSMSLGFLFKYLKYATFIIAMVPIAMMAYALFQIKKFVKEYEQRGDLKLNDSKINVFVGLILVFLFC